jgi:hypothetical protein
MFKPKEEMGGGGLRTAFTYYSPQIRKITISLKHTNIGIAFRNTNALQLTKPKILNQKPEHDESRIYELTCNTCRRSFIRQTGHSLILRFQEHVRYIKHSEPQSAYALHILNCKHEYGTISDIMSRLKHIDKPSLLLPYGQMYIQLSHHNNSFRKITQMNKFLCSNYFITDTVHHTPSDILISTSTSTRPNQFHSTLHTRLSSTQVRLPIHQLYFYCIFFSSFNY